MLSFLTVVAPTQYTIWDAFTQPVDISTYGHYIDSLFNYITAWNIFYFFLVCAGLFGFSYLYSAKRHPKPEYTHGYRPKQKLATMAIGLAVFITIDIFIATKSTLDLKNVFWNFPSRDEEVIRVEVLAQQWMWLFRYAGADGLFNTDDDYISNHELVLPLNKKVEFRLTSKDVIHSFYLPNARNKVDAMPGRISRMWFEATKTGRYDIGCAEMCGTHHYQMKARLVIYDAATYEKWKTESELKAKFMTDPNHSENYWGWAWENN
jgi:cytochrome c oxidase subunit 2